MLFIFLVLKYGLFAAMLVGIIYAIMIQLQVQLQVLRIPEEETQSVS